MTRKSPDSKDMEGVEENLRKHTEALQRETRNSPVSAPLPTPPAAPRLWHLEPVGGLLTVPNLSFPRASPQREITATAAAAIASTGGMPLAQASSYPPAPNSPPPDPEQATSPNSKQGPPPPDQEKPTSPRSTPNQPLSDRAMMPPPPLPLKANLPPSRPTNHLATSSTGWWTQTPIAASPTS